MKSKIASFVALTILVGAFFLPTSALAKAGDEIPEEISAPLPTPVETPAPTPEPPQSPWADAPETGNPFTPDGQATVVDNATDEDGKEFFTFQTPEGNVFFLIIDRSRGQDNVYFLNAVTEQDLMALAEVSNTNDSPFSPVPQPLPPSEDDNTENDPEQPEPSAPASSGNGTFVFLIIGMAAFGGAAYYLKIVRPKKQASVFDEDDYQDDEEVDFDEDLDEDYDVDDIIRKYGSGNRHEEIESDDEEENLFDEIQ